MHASNKRVGDRDDSHCPLLLIEKRILTGSDCHRDKSSDNKLDARSLDNPLPLPYNASAAR